MAKEDVKAVANVTDLGKVLQLRKTKEEGEVLHASLIVSPASNTERNMHFGEGL